MIAEIIDRFISFYIQIVFAFLFIKIVIWEKQMQVCICASNRFASSRLTSSKYTSSCSQAFSSYFQIYFSFSTHKNHFSALNTGVAIRNTLAVVLPTANQLVVCIPSAVDRTFLSYLETSFGFSVHKNCFCSQNHNTGLVAIDMSALNAL